MQKNSASPTIHVIMAVGNDGVFGWNEPGGKLMPWGHVREDFEFFKKLTTGKANFSNAVIMGFRTWESLPAKSRPLPNRVNVVIDRDAELDLRKAGGENIIFVKNLNSAFAYVQEGCFEQVFLIGGKSAILNYLQSDRAKSNLSSLYVNIISTDGVCIDQSLDIPSTENCIYFPEMVRPIEHFPELGFRLKNESHIACTRKDVTLLSCQYTRQLE